MTSAEYLVALPFAPWQIGPYDGSNPLHCTIMHWFSLPPSFQESSLKEELLVFGLELCRANIELVALEPSLFGPDANVPVSVLEKNETLMQQHQYLLHLLRSKRCSLPREDWIGDHYRPHVTVNNKEVFEIGQRHKVTSLALLKRAVDGSKSVIFQMIW